MSSINMKLRIIFAASLIVSVIVWVLLYEEVSWDWNSISLKDKLLSKVNIGPNKLVTNVGIITFLCTRTQNDNDTDHYFNATRVLAYKFLHDPITKTKQNIPFVVMVSASVQEWKREQLIKDGAFVIEVDYIDAKHDAVEERWIDQYTKLRIWQLTMYDRLLYLDSDILITKCMDGIFEDPFSFPIPVRAIGEDYVEPGFEDLPRHPTDNENLPEKYLLASVDDSGSKDQPIPRPERAHFNAGFFMLKPSLKLFHKYVKYIDHPEKYDKTQMEQGLLNYIHRLNSNMPWKRLTSGVWNVNWPSYHDYEYGVASLHEKFWANGVDPKLVELWNQDLEKALQRDRDIEKA